MAVVIAVWPSFHSKSGTPSRKTLNTRQLFIAVKKTLRSSFLFANFESTYFGWKISLLTQGLIRNSVEIWIGKLDANPPPLNFHFSAVKSDKTKASAPHPPPSKVSFQFFNSEFHREALLCANMLASIAMSQGCNKIFKFLEKRCIYGQFLWFHSSENRQNAFLLDSAEWVKAFARITLVVRKKNTFIRSVYRKTRRLCFTSHETFTLFQTPYFIDTQAKNVNIKWKIILAPRERRKSMTTKLAHR